VDLAALIAIVVAFYASAPRLQVGPATAVITFTSLRSNIVALLGGILACHEPIGHTHSRSPPGSPASSPVILGAALPPGRHHAGAPTPADTQPLIPDAAIAVPQQAAS
jgi:hypothetical protein